MLTIRLPRDLIDAMAALADTLGLEDGTQEVIRRAIRAHHSGRVTSAQIAASVTRDASRSVTLTGRTEKLAAQYTPEELRALLVMTVQRHDTSPVYVAPEDQGQQYEVVP